MFNSRDTMPKPYKKRKKTNGGSKKNSRSRYHCLACNDGPYILKELLLHMKTDANCKKSIVRCPHCLLYETPIPHLFQQHLRMTPYCREQNYKMKNPDVVELPKNASSSSSLSPYIPDNRVGTIKTGITKGVGQGGSNTQTFLSANPLVDPTCPEDRRNEGIMLVTVQHGLTVDDEPNIPIYNNNSTTSSSAKDNEEVIDRMTSKILNSQVNEWTGPGSMAPTNRYENSPSVESSTLVFVTNNGEASSASGRQVDEPSSSPAIFEQEESHVEFDVNFEMFEEEDIQNNTIEQEPETQEYPATSVSIGLGVRDFQLHPIDMLCHMQEIRENSKYLVLSKNNELPYMELLLETKSAPLYIIDGVLAWHTKWSRRRYVPDNQMPCLGYYNSRATLLKHLSKIVFQNEAKASALKHRVTKLTLSDNYKIPMTRFSFKNYIADIITDSSIWHSDNVWFDPENPYRIPEQGDYIGDLNTGSWWENAVNLCNRDVKEVPLNYIVFIDGLKIDNYGKIECEAVICCCGWLKRHARNRSSSWFILGFLENIGKLRNSENAYGAEEKATDYHKMLDHLFEEIKEINNHGGMHLSVPKLNGNGFVDVIARPQLQFVIGDCKGNNLLTGRYGSHGIKVNHLCRDCDVPTIDADEPFRCCIFRTTLGMQRMDLEDLRNNSFHNINKNAFWDLPFGGNPGGIYTSTPIEVLHGISLGICVYISDHMVNKFTDSFHEKMLPWAKLISSLGRRQSERNIPDLKVFSKGLMKLGSLTGDEKTARIFMLYLMFMQSEFIQDVLFPRNVHAYFKNPKNEQGREEEEKEHRVAIELHHLHTHMLMFEKTLCLHAWLKSDFISKDDVRKGDGRNAKSPADRSIESYMELMRNNLYLLGNVKTNTTKFHQLKHFVKYIREFGVPQNFDGGILEHHGKEIVKNLAQKTNKKFSTISQDISNRFFEERLVERAVSTHLMNKQSDVEHLKGARNLDLYPSCCKFGTVIKGKRRIGPYGARFKISRDPVDHDTPGTFDTVTNRWIFNETVKFNWQNNKKRSNNALYNFPTIVIAAVADRLFYHPANLGGRICELDPNVYGFCEYYDDSGNIYRCDPQCLQEGEWYDWAYFRWEGFDEPLVGKIHIMLDLSKATISTEEPDTGGDILRLEEEVALPFLTKECWCLIKAGKSSRIPSGSFPLTDYHFESRISDRVELEEEYRLVPMSALVGPAYVIENVPTENNKILNSVNRREGCTLNAYDNTVIVVKTRKQWAKSFVDHW